MDLNLARRVVVVAGASNGIGRSVALALGREGANVAIGARRREELEHVAREIEAIGGRAKTSVGDLVEPQAIQDLVATAAEWGFLDGVVACVGSTPLGTFRETSDDFWRRAFEMKFLATVRLVRASLPLLNPRGARIVIVAGNSHRAPAPHMVSSAAMNGALSTLAATLTQELGSSGIGAVCVDPGPVRTGRYSSLVGYLTNVGGPDSDPERGVLDAIPDGRVAEPEEVATLVTFLLSPQVSHLSGTSVAIDGGQSAGR